MRERVNTVYTSFEPFPGNIGDLVRRAGNAADRAQHPQLVSCPNTSVTAWISQESMSIWEAAVRLAAGGSGVRVVFVRGEGGRQVVSVYVLTLYDVARSASDRPTVLPYDRAGTQRRYCNFMPARHCRFRNE